MGNCRNCGKQPPRFPFRLCTQCWSQPGVRSRFEQAAALVLGDYGELPEEVEDDEPTEEELERIIEEQRRNLPSWWREETLKVIEGRDDD